jgi:RNA polymerase sigma-70 factor (ECF subfamily)
MSIDELIVEGIIAQNRNAQRTVFDRYKSIMMGICMRYCKSRDEAEDVMMEGFMTIFSEAHTFRKDGAFEHWMKRIMVNTAINNYRKNLKHYFHSDIDEIDERTMIRSDVTENYSAKDLMKVMQELPEGYKVVFNLYAVEGYKHKEIARMLGITVGTSKSQLSKARKMLQGKVHIK